MARPFVLKGVLHGKTIVLDEEVLLPEGSEVTLHLILTQEQAFRMAAGGWADMTPEEVAEYEALLTELRGEPHRLPNPDPS